MRWLEPVSCRLGVAQHGMNGFEIAFTGLSQKQSLGSYLAHGSIIATSILAATGSLSAPRRCLNEWQHSQAFHKERTGCFRPWTANAGNVSDAQPFKAERQILCRVIDLEHPPGSGWRRNLGRVKNRRSVEPDVARFGSADRSTATANDLIDLADGYATKLV